MAILHLFGDSYTQGHNLDLTYHPYQAWKNFRKGTLPPTWGELLAEKLKLTLSVRAIAGMSNHEIFMSFCEHAKDFTKGDIVIINWTYMPRFRWASFERDKEGDIIIDTRSKPTPKWKRLGGGINADDLFHINKSTLRDILLNRTEDIYLEEIYHYENLIEQLGKAMGFQFFFWSAENSLIFNLPKEKQRQRKYILHDEFEITGSDHHFFEMIKRFGGFNINDDTNGAVLDNHLGESGHKVQSEMFYDYIVNGKYQHKNIL
jgi:hypothetical protein